MKVFRSGLKLDGEGEALKQEIRTPTRPVVLSDWLNALAYLSNPLPPGLTAFPPVPVLSRWHVLL